MNHPSSIRIVIALTLAAATLAACGGGSSSAKTATPTIVSVVSPKLSPVSDDGTSTAATPGVTAASTTRPGSTSAPSTASSGGAQPVAVDGCSLNSTAEAEALMLGTIRQVEAQIKDYSGPSASYAPGNGWIRDCHWITDAKKYDPKDGTGSTPAAIYYGSNDVSNDLTLRATIVASPAAVEKFLSSASGYELKDAPGLSGTHGQFTIDKVALLWRAPDRPVQGTGNGGTGAAGLLVVSATSPHLQGDRPHALPVQLRDARCRRAQDRRRHAPGPRRSGRRRPRARPVLAFCHSAGVAEERK